MQKINKILIGTHNKGKFIEISDLLPKNIEKISPDFISTGNIGCMTQISSGTRIPIVHTVELLDWFTGGPKPNKLNNF